MRALSFSPALTLVAAIMAGSCMDATIKYLAHSNHVLLVTFAFAAGEARMLRLEARGERHAALLRRAMTAATT